MRAQIAACRVGDRGLGALVERYGLETFLRCVRTIWHQSEALAREQVARIKPGKYEAEALFDSDGVNLDRPVPLKVKVEVAGGEMTIDFSEISDQVPGSINSGESGAVAAARVAFKSLVAPYSPIDEGCFRPLKIVIPRGKNSERHAAVAGGQLEPHVADGDRFDSQSAGAGDAGTSRGGAQRRYGRLRVLRHQSEDRQKVSLPDDHGRRLGRARARRRRERHGVDVPGRRAERAGRVAGDLLSRARSSVSGCAKAAAAAGKFRGGLGIEVSVRVLCDAFTNINVERQRTAPWGLFGGECGATAKALVKQSPDDPGAWLTKKPNYPLKKGGSVTFFTAGGGGYGSAKERACELVERDRRLGYVPATRIDVATRSIYAESSFSLVSKARVRKNARSEVTMEGQQEFESDWRECAKPCATRDCKRCWSTIPGGIIFCA